jgi:hypothetical protein
MPSGTAVSVLKIYPEKRILATAFLDGFATWM